MARRRDDDHPAGLGPAPGSGLGPVPELAFAVATRDSSVRLRWLLNAVEEGAGDAEVVIATPSTETDVFRRAREHPLAQRGRLRAVPRSSAAGIDELCDGAWRAASAALVVFVLPDMRPAPEFVPDSLRAAAEHPGEVLEARVEPDPLDLSLMASPLHHVARRAGPWPVGAVWPRDLLEAGGLPPRAGAPVTEARAHAAGLVLYAAVHPFGRPAAVLDRLARAVRGERS